MEKIKSELEKFITEPIADSDSPASLTYQDLMDYLKKIKNQKRESRHAPIYGTAMLDAIEKRGTILPTYVIEYYKGVQKQWDKEGHENGNYNKTES
jgi:hypothetical protein